MPKELNSWLQILHNEEANILFAVYISLSLKPDNQQKVFDVHFHGGKDYLLNYRYWKSRCIESGNNTFWDLQNDYRNQSDVNLLFGLMFPCPNGKAPYSLQRCYGEGEDLPSTSWVEALIRERKSAFLAKY